jgi:CheY-like chemotaxis protein
VVISTGFQNVHRGVDASGEETVDGLVVMTVADNGPGIPEENIRHIFEPFYTRKVMGMSGTGLGLTVVWNVVNEHGGRIEVESNPEGTAFTLFFPAAEGDFSERQESRPESLEMNCKGRILVIDDELLQRNIARKMLTRFGYDVDVCSSGEEAVGFLKERQADLLVLDMLMPPGINGLETYRRILEIHPRQKAIIVSGYSENKDVKRAMQLGAGSFVKKPYSLHDIAQSVKKELESELLAQEEY